MSIVSIITPSFNQGPFLEETIRSVLSQNYQQIEYIIMDGGSNDQSVEIIRKYESSLKYWESAPDKGQADAIARGFEKSSGEILGYLNSDDFYYPGVVKQVVDIFKSRPDIDWIIGKSNVVDVKGILMYKWTPPRVNFHTLLFFGPYFHQPASFWRRSAYFTVGGFNSRLKFAFDYDFYIRLSKRNRPYMLNYILAAFRLHKDSKTSTLQDLCRTESELLQKEYGYQNYPKLLRKTFSVMFTRYVWCLQYLNNNICSPK